MAASKAEQVRGCEFARHSSNRYAKKRLARARRRAERRDPENAGRRIRDYTFGWVD